MARRKTRLQRMLDLKPAAYKSFLALTDALPAARGALSFHPRIGPVPDRALLVSEDSSRRIALSDVRHGAALEKLAPHNWDVFRDNIVDRDPFAVRRQIALIGDALVTGHTLTPIDPETGLQIGVGRAGLVNWFYARPQGLPRRTIAFDGPAFALNPYWNMWHILIEMMIPLVRAARLQAWGDAELTVLTRERRPAFVDAMIEGLRATLGARIAVRAIGPLDNVRARSLLVADNVCCNVERSFGFPEAIADLRAAFEAAYGRLPDVTGSGRKLYVTRGGAKLRQVINEGEVMEAAKAEGYVIFKPEWSNHVEQLAAFTQAERIVGVHGAGLTNLLFANPGTRVLELFPFDHRKTSMLHLSAEMGLDHRSLLGGKEGVNQAFSVDVTAFKAALAALEDG